MTSLSAYSRILTLNFNPQLIFKELASEIGLEESIVLQQIHYWLDKNGKSIGGNVWIYNTYNQWQEQFCYWSNSKIVRIFTSLKKQGFIFSKKMNACKSNHTNWYAINYEKLVKTIEGLIPEKKFARTKIGKSFCQNDQIIIGKTNNNYTKNNLSKEQMSGESRIKRTTQPQLENQTDYSIFDKEVCEEMLIVWNKVFIQATKPITLTKKRGKKLYNLWKEVFAEDVEQWRDFCISVNSSKFLMGEKKNSFKAHFDWIISRETVTRIRAGEFDIGDRVPDIKQAEIKQATEKAKVEFDLKLEEQRQKRMEENRKLEIEKLSEKLAREELAKIEAGWTEDDFSKAKQAFETFLEKEVANIENGETLQIIKNGFEREGWQTPFIDYAFEEFKLKKFLKKKYEDFIDQARDILTMNLGCSLGR